MIIRFAKSSFPIQNAITEDDVLRLQTDTERRRWKLNDEWKDLLKPPQEAGNDWSLTLPCKETFWNAFLALDINSIGPRPWGRKKNLCGTFLDGIHEECDELDKIRQAFMQIGKYIGIRDNLALSFAVDFDRSGPEGPRTLLGNAIFSLKYGNLDDPAMQPHLGELVEHLLTFVADVECYSTADSVCCVPPSNPTGGTSIPKLVATQLAPRLNKTDLTEALTTIGIRTGLKNVGLDNKLDTIRGTIQVDGSQVSGRTIILIDDLYQSGVTMNYAAMMLMEAGARAIFGLSCVKTLRNDDNQSRL
ncbi:MAG: hypothetical protein WD208_10820 [Dehalococcoidia bacterium]